MSLQVWLPLDGNLNQQGIFNVPSFTIGSSTTISDNGIIGKCYSFNGTQNSYIEFNNGNISQTTELTVAFWVKQNTVSPAPVYFDFAAGGDLWQFVLSGNTINTRDSASGQSGTRKNYTLSFSPVVDTWYHLALTWDSGEIKFYLNGTLTNTVGDKIANLHLNNITDLTFGTGWSSSNVALNGYINDIRIYNNVLSTEEIKKISQGLKAHYLLNSMPYWPSIYQNSDYTFVEYLESTGTQYINTELKYLQDYNSTLTNIVDGYFTVSSGRACMGGYDSGGQLGQVNGNWSVETNTSSVSCLDRKIIKQIFDLVNNTDVLYYQDAAICQRSVGGAKSSAQIFGYTFFRANRGTSLYDSSSSRIYSIYMYTDDILKYHLVPAIRNKDNEPGMYDILSQRFFTNQGTGTFLYGSIRNHIPYEYSPLEWIQSNGQSYFSSGIAAQSPYRLREEVLYTQHTGASYQACGADGTLQLALYNDGYWGVGNGKSGTQAQLNTWYIAEINHETHQLIVDDVVVATRSQTSSALMGVFAHADGGYAEYCKKKWVQIYNGDTLIKDYRPVMRKSDGKIGMYDIISQEFITSASTTDFLPGPGVGTIEYDISGFHHDLTSLADKDLGMITSNNSVRYKKAAAFKEPFSLMRNESFYGDVKTISFWIYLPTAASSTYLAWFADARSHAAGGFGNSVLVTSCNVGREAVNVSTLKINDWNHIVLIYTNSALQSCYINNILATTNGSTNFTHDNSSFSINGRSISGSMQSRYNGIMSDFRIYGTALSANDVAELYNMGRLS